MGSLRGGSFGIPEVPSAARVASRAVPACEPSAQLREIAGIPHLDLASHRLCWDNEDVQLEVIWGAQEDEVGGDALVIEHAKGLGPDDLAQMNVPNGVIVSVGDASIGKGASGPVSR
jgi:hypothetical protein